MKSGKLGTLLLLLEAHLIWLFALSVRGHDNGECIKVCVGHRHTLYCSSQTVDIYFAEYLNPLYCSVESPLIQAATYCSRRGDPVNFFTHCRLVSYISMHQVPCNGNIHSCICGCSKNIAHFLKSSIPLSCSVD